MTIERWEDGIWLVKLAGEPALSEDLILVRDQAAEADEMPDIVIDFSGISQLNSSNLSQLLRIRKLVVDREARLRLAAIPDGIWVVFMTTGLDKVFEFSPDLMTALASMQIED